jgi:hypothetical protein
MWSIGQPGSIGQPSRGELECLARIKLWEDALRLHEELFPEEEDEPGEPKRRPRPDFDWRIVVLRANGG